MRETDGEFKALTSEESWRAINATMDRARNSCTSPGRLLYCSSGAR